MGKTNLLDHYNSVKTKYNDCIIFYRLGDFYEMFNEDAIECSRVLDITLTGKFLGLDEKTPMCGIPFHAYEQYLKKLIEKGYKVAICEQLTSENEKITRDVVRIVSAGTVYEEEFLDEKKNNYLCTIFFNGNDFGIAYSDISTGAFETFEIRGDLQENINQLNDFLVRIKPSELLCNAECKPIILNLSAYKMNYLVIPNVYYDWTFDIHNADKSLKKQFGEFYVNAFDLKNDILSISSCGALVEYFVETQKKNLAHVNKIIKVCDRDYMVLDLNTRRNLEIIETIRDRKKRGSLLWLMDNTLTNMGAREFRKWIDEPLCNEKSIIKRQNGIEELIGNSNIRETIAKHLSNVHDMERLCGKIAIGNITPKDCYNLALSLSRLPDLKNALSNTNSAILKEIFSNILDFTPITNLLLLAFDEKAPVLYRDGNFIRSNYNEQLKEFRTYAHEGTKIILQLENSEREKTGIKNLKIGYNRVFGYYIEVNKSQSNLVPLNYVRRQTISNNERYITEELKIVEDKILTAQDNSLKLEIKLFNEIKSTLLDIVQQLQLVSKNIAILDCLYSMATLAIKNNYVKPKVSSKLNHIKIVDGRHPVVESLLKNEDFVANDTLLDQDENRIMIITGPNMAGKSTYMRQVAIITLMAHMGSFVPVKEAEISLTDRIFTRVGASDDLAFGQSTFMVEMSEVALILNNATDKSLVILDEIGRGTSTFDGLAIAWSVVENISKRFKCKTLFATHYHELTDLEGMIDGVKNYRISIKEFNGSIVFLRKIVRGGANKSFGIEVAKLAGLDKEVIERAKQISSNLESSEVNSKISLQLLDKQNISKKQENDKNLMQVGQILKDINIETLSPLDAFDTLNNLISLLKGKK